MQSVKELVALRKESVDRNIMTNWKIEKTIKSLSARRAWIEIIRHKSQNKLKEVALRKESVDRNLNHLENTSFIKVALRKESVDRNRAMYLTPLRYLVALRKESVDRNTG